MGYYLLDHPNPHGDHFYRSRRGELRVIVVHITAGLEDLDSKDDHSAEATAQYAATTDRQVSWHSGSDSDSALLLLPESFTAFQCQGYNSTSYGHEISKATTKWAGMDPAWITATLARAAACIRPIAVAHKIPPRRLTRAQVDAGERGFASHADLDPKRRTDPGADFPWNRFLALVAGAPNDTKEDDDMDVKVWRDPQGTLWLVLYLHQFPVVRWQIDNITDAGYYAKGKIEQQDQSEATVAAVPLAGSVT